MSPGKPTMLMALALALASTPAGAMRWKVLSGAPGAAETGIDVPVTEERAFTSGKWSCVLKKPISAAAELEVRPLRCSHPSGAGTVFMLDCAPTASGAMLFPVQLWDETKKSATTGQPYQVGETSFQIRCQTRGG